MKSRVLTIYVRKAICLVMGLVLFMFIAAVGNAHAASIKVISPNGGETWSLGDRTKTINWTSSGVSNVTLELLRNGTVVGVIADGISAAAGSYPWPQVGFHSNGTATPASGYKVRIKASAGGGTAHDESNGSFTISCAPLNITTSQLSDGEVGSLYHGIGFPLYLGSMQITTSGGQPPVTFKEVVPNSLPPGLTLNSSGSITGTPTKAGDYRFTVQSDDKCPLGVQVKQQTYRIAVSGPIKVTSPNGGERWTEGTTQTITWSAPTQGTMVNIGLYRDRNLVGNIVFNVYGGSYQWKVGQLQRGATAAPGDGYKIQVDSSVLQFADHSNGLFSILPNLRPLRPQVKIPEDIRDSLPPR